VRWPVAETKVLWHTWRLLVSKCSEAGADLYGGSGNAAMLWFPLGFQSIRKQLVESWRSNHCRKSGNHAVLLGIDQMSTLPVNSTTSNVKEPARFEGTATSRLTRRAVESRYQMIMK